MVVSTSIFQKVVLLVSVMIGVGAFLLQRAASRRFPVHTTGGVVVSGGGAMWIQG
jgi:hypothetical protein